MNILPSRSRKFGRFLSAVTFFLTMSALIEVTAADQWPTYLHDSGRSGVTSESLALPLAPVWTYRSVHPLCPSWSESARHDFFHYRRGLREHVIFDRALHVVSDGSRIFFGSTVDDTVRCRDAATGREIWRFSTAGPVRGTPLLKGDRLLFGSDDGTLRAVSAESGKLLWSIPPRGPEKMVGNGRLISRWPIRTTVVVDGDIGYYSMGLFPKSEGVYFRKFNVADGHVLSEKKLTQPAQGSPVLAGERVIVPAGRVTPTLLTQKEPDWLLNRLGRGRSDTYATSAESDGVVVVGNGCEGCLDAYSKTSQKRIGHFTGLRAAISKELIVIQSDTTLQAIKRDNYFEVLEKLAKLQEKCKQQKRRGQVDESLVQELVRLKRQPAEQVKWTVPSQGRYALIQTADMLFTGGENRVEAFSLETGKRLWSREVIGRVYGLAVAGGRLFVSTSQGMIYAFEPKQAVSVAEDRETPKQPEAAPTRPLPTSFDEATLGAWHFRTDCLVAPKQNETGSTIVDDLVGSCDAVTSAPIAIEKHDTIESAHFTQSGHFTIATDTDCKALPRESFTAEALVRIDKPSDCVGFIGSLQDNGSCQRGWLLGCKNNCPFLALCASDSDEMSYLTTKDSIRIGTWHHFLGTYDGKMMRLYHDGIEVGRCSWRSGPIRYPENKQSQYVIGAYKDDDEEYNLTGQIATVQVFKRALTPEEVAARAKRSLASVPETSELIVHPNVLSSTADSVEVEWSAQRGDPNYLQYGLVGNAFSQETKGTVVNHFHVAHLSDLEQAAVYQARVVQPRPGQEPRYSETFYFRTEVDPKSLELPEAMSSQPLTQSAEKLLAMSSGQKGFCVILYPEDARLAVELARTERWQVILVAKTETQANEIRRSLNRLSLGGRYITVLHGPLETLGLPPYFADFVIGPTSEQSLASAKEAYRIVRPEGGRLLLSLRTKDTPQNAKLVPDPLSESSSSASPRLLAVRGTLPGAGTWKQGLGEPGQTGQSNDERVYGPMRVLWFGKPGPRRMADRHHRNPPPLYANGRMFVPGDQILFAVCAYSGTPLWQKIVPDSRRLGTFLDSSNLSLDEKHLYWAVKDQCLRIDVANGKETLAPLKLPPEDAGKRHWGYVAALDAEDGLVLGTSVEPTAGYKEMSFDGDLLLWYDAMELIMGKSLFAHNRQDGSLRWTYRGGAIINTTIAIGPEHVYFLESESREAIDNPVGRVPMWICHRGDCYLTALNLHDGSVAWRKKIDPSNYYHIAYLNYVDGKLLLSGNRYLDKNLWYFFTCYDAKEGKPIWSDKHNTKFKPNGGHGEQNRHPTIVGSTAYIYPYAYDLATGKRDPDFHFNRGGHGCGNVSASQGALFYRGGNPQQRDLVNGGGTQKVNTVSRPGCWINMIPAGGLLMIPEASSGCTCAYPLQTSLTYIPDSDVSKKK